MKHLSFRIIFLCIFLPPVLYIFSIQALETLIHRQWSADLQQVLLSDTNSLLQGRIGIENEIEQNIDRYLTTRYLLKWGVVPRIVVKTKTGRWLYPTPYKGELYPHETGAPLSGDKDVLAPTNMLRVAEENLRLMNEGIILSLDLEVPRNSLLANSVLVFYILVFASLLYWAYRKRASEAERLSLENQQALEAASVKVLEAQERVAELSGVEQNYQRDIEKLQTEVATATEKLHMTEEQALEEIEKLEVKIQQSVAARQEMEEEVLRLQEESERLESSRKPFTRRQAKQIDSTTKRFRTLYKNLEFHERAIEGFLNLQSEMQLKAEEFIHNINEDESRLSVKRKVFAGKGALPTFECDFAYRGRVYWKKSADGRTEILGIGTKNTQAKDLAYVKKLGKEEA
jgi:hypothetical protein